MSNTGPVALVSGASRGLGRAIAVRLARDGFDVAGTYVRDEAAAAGTREAVAAGGRRCSMCRCDVADPEAVARLLQDVADEFGRLDVVVHNAGIASRGREVADTSAGEIARVLGVHALGAFHLISRSIPLLRRSDRGNVVLVSSTATSNPKPGGAPYMMGKAALEALGETLSLEEAPHGTRVNIVAPGLVATEMGNRLARAASGVDAAGDLDARMPLGRVTRPEDVADTVAFLVSEEARQITGQRIEVHGGFAGVPRP
ncbi:SDR family NAD(P)-dependent oxidoreductase [Rhodococcus aetherivorans]|uniref:SDR family NAD(P)-dependent oxidoreductase n=1 Tax=Rhodococcus aetherivorans TaxID=191292 RepID=UPI00241C2CFC|nr:SDR family oxidoreductase [Rhodococcus aetherivorans]WFS11034.1 SDR family oxidoreductase [Rhodococcus aetherivorans]